MLYQTQSQGMAVGDIQLFILPRPQRFLKRGALAVEWSAQSIAIVRPMKAVPHCCDGNSTSFIPAQSPQCINKKGGASIVLVQGCQT